MRSFFYYCSSFNTFYVKYCSVLAQYGQIFLNFRIFFFKVNIKNCITTSHFMPFSATKNLWLAICQYRSCLLGMGMHLSNQWGVEQMIVKAICLLRERDYYSKNPSMLNIHSCSEWTCFEMHKSSEHVLWRYSNYKSPKFYNVLYKLGQLIPQFSYTIKF